MTFIEAMIEFETAGKKAHADGDEERAMACAAVYNTIYEAVQKDPFLANEEFEIGS